MPASVERRAAAKINLALHVVGRRPDGYHDLDTIAVFADAGDELSIREAEDFDLSIVGRFAHHAPAGETNLVLRAAEALRTETGCRHGARLQLVKNLPAGAGLGGGSSDAAAVLQTLNELWGLGLAAVDLARIGENLGADVPMCLAGQALRAGGKGERLAAIDNWPDLPLLLVWPGVPVSTARVFASLSQRENPPLPEWPRQPTLNDLVGWLKGCRNDLELPAIAAAPEIGETLAALRATSGCLLARMSGSGSGCFGIYADPAQADAAASAIGKARPGWWVAATIAR